MGIDIRRIIRPACVVVIVSALFDMGLHFRAATDCDVRVGAVVNVAGDASHNHHGLLARASYLIDPDGTVKGAPTLSPRMDTGFTLSSPEGAGVEMVRVWAAGHLASSKFSNRTRLTSETTALISWAERARL